MASTDAARARRYRRHKSGDHSLCVPDRCAAATADDVTNSVTHPVTLPTVTANVQDRLGLEEAGRRLWAEMTADAPLGPLQSVLLTEACRITDRLDKLDRQLRGEDWLRFRHNPEDEHEVVVYVDKVLSEAREQATALKGLVVELRQSTAKQPPKPKQGGGGLADLTARIAARRSAPAG